MSSLLKYFKKTSEPCSEPLRARKLGSRKLTGPKKMLGKKHPVGQPRKKPDIITVTTVVAGTEDVIIVQGSKVAE